MYIIDNDKYTHVENIKWYLLWAGNRYRLGYDNRILNYRKYANHVDINWCMVA